jgi:hypothetical protein
VTPSAELKAKLALVTPTLHAASARLWSLPGVERRYPEYLRVMHGVVRASVPLMQLAAERCGELAAHDPSAGPLRDYLRLHSTEEHGHDEWLLSDIAASGAADARTVVSEQPAPAVARLVGPQYYWIRHHHPACLLGYIAVLESNAPSARLAGHLTRRAHVPPAALRTVREHAVSDVGHAEAVFDLVDRLRLPRPRLNALTVSALTTADALADLYDHIVRTALPRRVE